MLTKGNINIVYKDMLMQIPKDTRYARFFTR